MTQLDATVVKAGPEVAEFSDGTSVGKNYLLKRGKQWQ